MTPAERPIPVCDYEGSDYQQSFWEQGGREYEDRVEAVALDRLLPEGGQRLLEIGAGAGRNTPRYHGFDQIVLLDYSRTQLEQARDRLGRSERYVYVAADVYRMPFGEDNFDAATMIRTLHHLAEPGTALKNVSEALVPGATFILEYANKQNLKAILRWIARRQEWNPFESGTIEFAPLNFDFHPEQVRAWLAEANFSVARQLTVSHLRLGLLKRLVPLGILVALDSLMQWTGDFWQLTPSVFLQARAAGEPLRPTPEIRWRCPGCGSIGLREVQAGLQCPNCGLLWPFQDGIFNFKEPLPDGPAR
ncbi:MAG: methyltransferase domain-containing protein [Anaerolineales bacterium]